MLPTTTNFDAKHDADHKRPVYLVRFLDNDVVFGSGGADSVISSPSVESSLVSHYSFEGSGSTATDVVGSSDGTIFGTPTRVTGQSGDGLDFNGSTQYVTLPAALGSIFEDSFSISLWVKHDDGQGAAERYISVYADDGESAVSRIDLLKHNTGILAAFYGVHGTPYVDFLNDTAIMPDGAGASFTHIVATFESGGYIKMYADAVLLTAYSASYDGDISGMDMSNFTIGSNNIYVGRAPDGSDDLSGVMDELKFYDKALTAAEVAAVYADES